MIRLPRDTNVPVVTPSRRPRNRQKVTDRVSPTFNLLSQRPFKLLKNRILEAAKEFGWIAR